MKLPRANSVKSEVVLAKSSASIFICFFPIPFALILLTYFPCSLRCLQKRLCKKWGRTVPISKGLAALWSLWSTLSCFSPLGGNMQSISKLSTVLPTDAGRQWTLPREAPSRAEGMEENHKEMSPCRSVSFCELNKPEKLSFSFSPHSPH